MEQILDDPNKNRTWLNLQVFGETPKGVPAGNSWRTDQIEIGLYDAFRTAKILNRSVEELTGQAHGEPAYAGTAKRSGKGRRNGLA